MCRYAATPKTRTEFWIDKLEENVRRDSKNKLALEKEGWNVLIIWECDLKTGNAILPAMIQRLQLI